MILIRGNKKDKCICCQKKSEINIILNNNSRAKEEELSFNICKQCGELLHMMLEDEIIKN
jgi:hypothetical protein